MHAKIKSTSTETLAAIFFAVGFFACAFLQGGYFFHNTVCTYIALAISVFLLIRKTDCRANLLFFAAVALLALSLFCTKGDAQSGLYEAQKALLFFVAIPIGSAWKNRSAFRKILFVCAAAIALVGIAAYCFAATDTELVLFDRYICRLQSLFGYANTTAVFLGCGYFAFLDEYKDKGKAYKRLMALGILIALYLTVSKAGIALFLLVGTLYMYKCKAHRGLFLFQNVLAAVGSLCIALSVGAHLPLLAVTAFLLALLCGICVRPKEKAVYFKLWTGLLLLAAIGAAVLLCIRPSLLDTLWYRLAYMKDALKLCTASPIFGNGPASFRLLQYGVQTTAYSVSHVHNGYLEFAVEIGLPFALLFTAVLLLAIVRTWKKGDFGAFSILLLLATHAAVDMDFSFAVILLTVGLLCGNALSAQTDKKTASLFTPVTAIAVGLITLSVFGYMLCEVCVRSNMERAYLQGDHDGAYRYALQLEKIAPRDSGVQITLAALEERNGGTTEEILQRLEKAIRLSPHDRTVYGDYMQYVRDGTTLRERCETYIAMAPLREDTYTFLSSLIAREESERRITNAEAESLLQTIHQKRKDNGVIDRNALLEEIIQTGEPK